MHNDQGMNQSLLRRLDHITQALGLLLRWYRDHPSPPLDLAIERKLDRIFDALTAQGVELMTAISDWKARFDANQVKVDAALEGISTSVTGVSGDVAELKALIEKLQTTPGPISTEDQATLDAAEVKVNETAAKLEAAASALAALDALTPPAPPPG